MSPLYTGPHTEDCACIPVDLKQRRQWVLWRGADRVDTQTGEVIGLNKIPINPQTLTNASTTDPETWGLFEECVAALSTALETWEAEDPSSYRGGGIGYVVTADDDVCGIDLDHCRNLETGHIDDWAQEYTDAMNSYTEVTPSQTGIRVWAYGKLPPGRRKRGNVEMYDQGRFFTVTGWHLPGTPHTIEARQDALNTLHTSVFGPQHAAQKPLASAQAAEASPLDDTILLDKAQHAQNGVKFSTLWSGDTSAYSSASEGDLALCTLLAFWTQDAGQIDRLFRQSGLMRNKWDEQHGTLTYGARTIVKALARQTEHYRPATASADTHQYRNGHTGGTRESCKEQPAQDKPIIELSTDITAIVDAAQKAIQTMPEGPLLFQRARQLCIIARGVPPPKWLKRPLDTPVIVSADAVYLRELAHKAATWTKFDKRGKHWEPTLPPEWAVKTLLARPSWPFPLLEGIVCTPTLRPDGVLLTQPGYDPDTALYLDTNRVTYPAIREHPTLDHARTAIGRLQEAFIDFPFAGSHFFSATLAAILSMVARYAITGCVPLFAVRSTTRGAGKGLLIDTIATIATGRLAPRWPQVQEEDEERKRLLTLALDGDLCTHIDNVTKPLGSAPLDAALTALTFKDRILGKSQSRETPMHVVFFASGNNMVFKGDTARRVVPIDLDPKTEKPEERDNFRYSPLLDWVQQERPHLVVAALTILRAYFTVGCPSQGIKPLGSFEQWSTLVRQALIWAGEPDPCEGRTHLEAESDETYEALDVLLHAWHTCYGTKAMTLKQAVEDIGLRATPVVDANNPANSWNALHEALSTFDTRYDGKRLDTTRIGNALRPIEGRVLGNRRLVRDGTYHRAAKWKIEIL